jgi:hypothetical protein
MAVTAKRLSQSGARGRELESIVREHLQIIDDKLLRAERTWGRNTLVHDLPVTFGLPGLDKRDAQRIVYSSILRSLDRRGFETRILLEPERTAVCVAWMTDLDSQEVEAMSAFIRAKRVTGEGLAPFVAHGALPAPNSAAAVRAGVAAPPPPMWVAESGAVMRPRGGVERRDESRRDDSRRDSDTESRSSDSHRHGESRRDGDSRHERSGHAPQKGLTAAELALLGGK